jgi:hypothetical protein
MAGRAPRVGLVLAVSALIVASGCGTATETQTTPVAQVPPVSLSIDQPDGETVAARVVDGQWVADVAVAGTSQPGSILRVTTGCADAACQRSAQTDEQGRWRVPLRAQTTAAKPYVRIIAELAGESAVGLVKLQPGAARGRAAKGKRGGSGSGSGGSGGSAGSAGGSGASSGSAGAGSAQPGTEGVPIPPPPPTIPGSSAPLPGQAGGGGASSLLLVGDSLGVGIQPLLPGQLPGWSVLSDSRVNRTLAEGMARWRAERADEAVDAFSLFTNDSPRNLAALETAVRETARDGCAVWATIARRTANGDSYGAANDLLGRLAAELPGRLVVVPWAAAVAEHPDWLGRDGVHPNQTGYRARAQLYAQAARSCA